MAYIVLLLSNLQATRVERKGKPIFPLKGAVCYRMAPTMEPPEQNARGYAQLYVLDPEDGLSVRLQQLLAGVVQFTVSACYLLS